MHTLALAIVQVFIVSICWFSKFWGGLYLLLSSRKARLIKPSCDAVTSQTNLKVMVGPVRASNGNTAGAAGSAEAGAAATGVRDDGKRAPPGCPAEAGTAPTGVREDGERAPRHPTSTAKVSSCTRLFKMCMTSEVILC